MRRLPKIAVFRILALLILVVCTGCLSPHSINPKNYPPLPDRRVDPEVFAKPDPLAGTWHGFRVYQTTNLDICSCQKLNPVWWLGNQDEPIPPPWYRPNARFRSLRWHLRNPMHNFSHYVVGVADKETVRFGRYPRSLSKPGGGWSFSVSKYKHVRLPFIDYRRGKFEFYFGWRTG